MQISHLSEDRSGAGEKYCDIRDNAVAQRDLVTLYENVDTKQTSNNKNSARPPNQYVETVVYNEDQESEGSDSEFYTNEDFYDVVMINKERLDLINSFPSLDKTLCQKFGNIAIQAEQGSDSSDGILFKSPLRKDQFNSLNRMLSFGSFDGAFFSTSLLDFVCCNNLDDNSNLYMDNIIQYAKRTIEQLRRISNGDYLTDKAKEKWKNLENKYEDRKNNEVVKVASASSNPLRIECNVDAFKTRWRDFIHSELDIRSLTRILEKRIIKIPRLIYGSFTFLDKRCENNLVITCQKESDQAASGDGNGSQIDIVVQLKSSHTDNTGSEIESVLVIRNSLPSIKDGSWLPLEFSSFKSETNITHDMQNQNTHTAFNNEFEDTNVSTFAKGDNNSTDFPFQYDSSGTKSSELSLCDITSPFTVPANDGTSNYSSEKNCNDDRVNNDDQVNNETQISCFRSTADDLFTTLQKLGTQSVVLEETEETALTKKKSPTKVRVKSPYENKSLILEEKKRRKLLEIRERREKKKKSLSENCKVTKHKHGKAVMAQASNSVTKLSITNKSFYTSIYGDKMSSTSGHSVRHSHIDPLDKDHENDDDSVNDVTILKKHNRVGYGYYLDDPETEVMNLKFKNRHTSNTHYKPSNSSNSTTNFDSYDGVASDNSSTSELKQKSEPCDSDKREGSCFSEFLYNSPRDNTDTNINNNYNKKSLTSVECKKSIDKIYELMKKLSKVDSSDSMYPSHKATPADTTFNDSTKDKKAKVMKADSCSSIKYQLVESNPSIFSFEGKNNEVLSSDKGSKKSGLEANTITKVIISSKPHVRAEKNETKPHKRVRINSPECVSKNPLKAISHLISEFDNIQKGRQRAAPEPRDYKKVNSLSESKALPRFNLPKKPTRGENESKEGKLIPNRYISNNDTKNQYRIPTVRGKTSTEPIGNMNKLVERERKVVDIVDEALREARGEAVKGPPRQFSRLDSLAQPKKSYVNAQMEAMKPRSGRNYLPGPPTPVAQAPRPMRQRRNDQEMMYVTSSKTSNSIWPKVTDKYKRVRRMPNSGPIEIVVPQVHVPTYKQRPVPEPPRTSKKMIPFETYPKRRPFTLSESVTSTNLLQKSPVATDFPTYQIISNSKDAPSSVATTSSFENDSTGDNKLRYDPPQHEVSVSLSVITESKTTMSCNEERNNFAGTLTSNDELVSICSDYIIDVFEDKNILTAVSNITKNNERNVCKKESNNEIQAICSDTNIPHNGIVRRIDSLEKALYNHISQGTFPKRLKIKKLTLTPKQSTNQVLLLQCGDANSMIEKSRISKKLHFGSDNSITSLINMPLFDTIQDRYFTKLPVDITTVGYVFSKPKSIDIKSIESSPATTSRCMGIQTLCGHDNIRKIAEYYNDEKGVQTIQINLNKNIKLEKIDKSTGLSKSLVSLNKSIEDEKVIAKTENIENTTSLDILVELLDEIEKITKYQNINASKVQDRELNKPYKLLSKSPERKPFNNICEMMNVDINRNLTKKINKTALNCVDKEVAVNITKEYVNECTETPQSLLINFNKIETNSITANITNLNRECIDLVTNADSQISTNKNIYENHPNSVTGIVSQPSSNSLISLYDYRTYCLRKFKLTPIHNYDGYNKYIEEQKDLGNNDLKNHGKYEIIHVKNRVRRKNVGISKDHKEVDILKMKRDILVTVYSILVFTVFAALSFPDFLYHS